MQFVLEGSFHTQKQILYISSDVLKRKGFSHFNRFLDMG